MRVLLLGSGGREHAIADTLHREAPSLTLVAAPGNPGLAELGEVHPVALGDPAALLALAERVAADLTIVGPEAPLAAGVVDAFRAAGRPIFGPTAAAARLEASKAFAKAVLVEAGVPTARAETVRDAHAAREAVHRFGAPVVIKASGLAAGKGVAVCQTLEEALAFIGRVVDERAFGAAGDELLVEECMTGEELSLFVLTDGTHALPLLPAQDHKRLGRGDTGPNTGGMGAYAPVALATPALLDEVLETIIHPTLHAMRARGTPFTGLLYAGLMLTPTGPRVVEFNCRFGDPETQAVLPLLASSLLEPMTRIARGAGLAGLAAPTFRPGAAVTTVVAAAGYPDAPRTGDPITLPAATDTLRLYHAGTARRADGTLVTAGGRVVAVTALADRFEVAQAASRAAAEAVRFAGAFHRDDIGWREAARRAAPPPA